MTPKAAMRAPEILQVLARAKPALPTRGGTCADMRSLADPFVRQDKARRREVRKTRAASTLLSALRRFKYLEAHLAP
jgi:hypothetical protein